MEDWYLYTNSLEDSSDREEAKACPEYAATIWSSKDWEGRLARSGKDFSAAGEDWVVEGDLPFDAP